MTVGALSDLRVVEYGSNVSAPFCARLFADLGAEVIKVEPPGGDASRTLGPFPDGKADPERSGMFHYLNTGKQGVVVDFDDADHLEFFHTLLAGADVLIENSEPADYQRLGLSGEQLIKRHPHLVTVSISAHGRSGPWADRVGTDLTAQAASSLPLSLGMPEREPVRIPFDQADYEAGFHAFCAALSAIRERDQSGRGQAVDISAAQVMAYQVGGMHLVGAKSGKKWGQRGMIMKGSPYPTGFFQCKDGFVCIASQTPKQWDQFLSLMGNPKWSKEGQASNSIYLGMKDAGPADSHFREWLMEYTREELLEMAVAEGIVMGVAQRIDEVLGSEQFAFRNLWSEVALGGKRVRVPKPGYLLSKTPTSMAESGPALDADGAALRANPPVGRSLAQGDRRERALDGVRVLDFGWNWAGPMAGQMLADMGAEVIRVETSKRQDLMRFLDYTSYFFCHNNRSKKSVTINVKTPQGAAILRKLACQADIVLDNFAAGVMAKNGIGYDDIVKESPNVICVSMSMAGQKGPLQGMRGFASIATGYSGLELMVGYPDSGVSTGLLPFGLGDTAMAVQAVAGALIALHHRDRTGEGQFVDVSQIDSSAASLGQPILDYQLSGQVAGPQGNLHPQYFPHGYFAASGEERWVGLAVRDAEEWQGLCKVLGRDDWAGDAALADVAARRTRAEEIDAGIKAWCADQDRDTVCDALAAAGVPAAPIFDLDERNAHPQFESRGLVWDHPYEGFDPCKIYGTPWLLSVTPPELVCPTPALGEHNDYVFKEILELPEDEIAKLVEAGILA
jgi:crotonobetainyl-CoA:carnitine CoA-transferase CaiB-like acyl-CoA transferase